MDIRMAKVYSVIISLALLLAFASLSTAIPLQNISYVVSHSKPRLGNEVVHAVVHRLSGAHLKNDIFALALKNGTGMFVSSTSDGHVESVEYFRGHEKATNRTSLCESNPPRPLPRSADSLQRRTSSERDQPRRTIPPYPNSWSPSATAR